MRSITPRFHVDEGSPLSLARYVMWFGKAEVTIAIGKGAHAQVLAGPLSPMSIPPWHPAPIAARSAGGIYSRRTGPHGDARWVLRRRMTQP